MWEHPDFTGRAIGRWDTEGGIWMWDLGFNDIMSSFKVGADCILELCVHDCSSGNDAIAIKGPF